MAAMACLLPSPTSSHTPIRLLTNGNQLPPPCESSRLRISSAMREDGVIRRRDLMLASGAAMVVSLGGVVEAAHAAAGVIETAEEAASNPLIQSMISVVENSFLV